MRSYNELVMHLTVICVVIFGFLVERSCGGPRDKLHINIHVPEIIDRRHHDEYELFKEPKKSDYKTEYDYGSTDPYFDGPYSDKLRQGYHYDDYEPYKQKPKPVKPKKEYSNSNPYGYEPYTDGYKKSWKTLRTEKYETETIENPESDNPANKYIVKNVYKVREKLPYMDTTVGYDHEYEYPLSEVGHEYDKNEKLVDFNNAKTDPFPSDRYGFEAPAEKIKEKKKPKKYHYHYKYPSSDHEYSRNVKIIDSYLSNKDKLDVEGSPLEEPKKSKEYYYNDLNYESPKNEKYQSSNFDGFGSSDEEKYRNYKTDGPSSNDYY